MTLPITLTIAAAAALINMWLAVRVGRVRMARNVMVGDGGDDLLVRRMRAQANFIEYTPFVLILLGLVEAARGSHGWLWAIGIAYILGRLAQPFGMERDGNNAMRMISIVVTMLTLLALAVMALVTVYAATSPGAAAMPA